MVIIIMIVRICEYDFINIIYDYEINVNVI